MLYLITKVKLILSSISHGWLFWSVNQTWMSWNSELNVVKKKKWFVGDISNNYQTVYLEQKCTRLESYW